MSNEEVISRENVRNLDLHEQQSAQELCTRWLDSWYKQMTYLDIKKILIRLKSRKFLTQECIICLDPITDKSICRVLSCYHIFHVKCIDSWFLHDNTCPHCKKAFNNPSNLQFNDHEFLRTINVDNEMFYSDHLVRDSHRLAGT